MRRDRAARRSASTASTSTACTPRSRRCSATSTRSTPTAARRARDRYACFDHFGEDPQAYGYAATLRPGAIVRGRGRRAARRAAAPRRRVRRRATADVAEDELFYAEQNARLVRTPSSTTARCSAAGVVVEPARRHMADTLDALVAHLERRGGRPKVVVWAHNSHLGDARATEMGDRGELNLGQLVRERYGHDAVLVGFTTYTGTVTAASDWDEPAERKRVRPALRGELRGAVPRRRARRDFFLDLRGDSDAAGRACDEPRLERAIGVIYRPETERLEPLLPRPAVATSSTPCSTSTRRAPSSRWSGQARGSAASSRRPIPRRSDER